MNEPNSTSATMQIVELLSKLLTAGYSYRSAKARCWEVRANIGLGLLLEKEGLGYPAPCC